MPRSRRSPSRAESSRRTPAPARILAVDVDIFPSPTTEDRAPTEQAGRKLVLGGGIRMRPERPTQPCISTDGQTRAHRAVHVERRPTGWEAARTRRHACRSACSPCSDVRDAAHTGSRLAAHTGRSVVLNKGERPLGRSRNQIRRSRSRQRTFRHAHGPLRSRPSRPAGAGRRRGVPRRGDHAAERDQREQAPQGQLRLLPADGGCRRAFLRSRQDPRFVLPS